jgi:hypothetical protein
MPVLPLAAAALPWNIKGKPHEISVTANRHRIAVQHIFKPANVCRFCLLNLAQGFHDVGADHLLQQSDCFFQRRCAMS